MIITLKDGIKIEALLGSSVKEIASQISEGLARVALAGRVDGKLVDLSTKVETDSTIEIITFRDDIGKRIYRHTASHILAQAVLAIYPTAQLAIGPAIDDGFYYDIDFKSPISSEDLPRIEEEMYKIIKANFPIERSTVTREEAMKLMTKQKADYKLEMISELPIDVEISFYKQGNFVDMCTGPHLTSTGMIKAVKLTQLTGAYWRGDEKNKMLSRIYGTAFDKKSDLDAYLTAIEEAKKRDHNKLGRELDIFMTDETVGQGLPLFKPKGAKLMQLLQRFMEDEEEKRGYVLTKTPYMAKSDLYKISGHWDHYRDKMFLIGDEKSDEVMALRPMTCPFQFTIYNSDLKSYKDLPIRYAETSTLFRKEASGEMHGLIRIRQFTLADAHIACTMGQLEGEFAEVLNMIYYLLDCIGLRDDVSFRFSKGDPNNTEKYINAPEAWERTEKLMKIILDNIGINYVEAIGEAAFYGPKLDIQARNVHGKEDTIITIQIDFALAERFSMTYIDEDGDKKHPIIIHHSSIGCYERTIAMLIEKYAGAFPLWISPEQVRVMSLTDRTIEKAKELVKELKEQGIRATIDTRSEKIGYKIRQAQLEKAPYMVILGDKEIQEEVLAVRSRKDGDIGTMSQSDFVAKLQDEIRTKAK